MKVDGKWMLLAVMVLTLLPKTEAGILDFFFGTGEEQEQEVQVVKPVGAGFILDDEEFELGKRGFECLQELAGVENEQGWGQNLMRPIARVVLGAYGKQGIETICNSPVLARMRSKRQAAQNNDNNNNSTRQRNLREAIPERRTIQNGRATTERRTEKCSSYQARYAGDRSEEGGSTVYETFALEHLDAYLVGDDRTQRSNAVKRVNLQSELSTIRGAQMLLSRCTQIWNTINQFIAAPDVPGVNQEAISETLQSFVCDLPSTYSNIGALRLQREQELINFHDALVNGAEVGAMYQNTNKLMSDLCERDSRLTAVLNEIDSIKQEINRM